MTIILNQFWKEYSAGYKKAQQYSEELQRRISPKHIETLQNLRENYSRSYKAWEESERVRIAKHQQSLKNWKKKRAIGVTLAIVLPLIIACVVSPILYYAGLLLVSFGNANGMNIPPSIILLITFGFGCFSLVLILLALVLGIITWNYHNDNIPRSERQLKKPAYPAYCSWNIDIVSRSFYQLENTPGELNSQITSFGSRGELQLLRDIQISPRINYFSLPNIMLTSGQDADVIVLAPNGIWVLESKYWQGLVRFEKGAWTHYRKYYERGGIPAYEAKNDTGTSPHEEVIRTVQLTKNILQERIPNIDWGKVVRGGIVFTHPDAILEISGECPVMWGRAEQFRQKIGSSVPEPELSTDVLLNAADILLQHSQKIKPLSFSAKPFAEIVEEINGNVLSEISDFEKMYLQA